ncbi:helix-turn-helix transcriptional regulator [Staphylococcus epidermidis]|uniref:helix-turn-helix transcriptional regulator n=1 Tax=Staphylococcus epidermidis TaxID=1282 RepID=UPI0030BD3B6F
MENHVKKFRTRNNWNQEELAKKVDVSRQIISLIERNRLIPSVIVATKIAKNFSINVENLFILEDKE